MIKKKIRLDNYLWKNGFSESLEKAKREIIAGWVKVNGETVREADRTISGTEEVHVARPGGRFASRGGEKLEHALKYFNISVKNKTAADIGASTGGFTDCLLKNGAKKVYSIDVGYGLLAHNLRTDPRVILEERTNVRNLKKDDFNDRIEFITIDLSFISVIKTFDTLKNIFPSASGIILVKPQFEAKPDEHKKGVVTDKYHHINILAKVIESLIKCGIAFKGLHFSPIKGPAGNIEFLLYFDIADQCGTDCLSNMNIAIENVVNEAHQKLI
ncbi:MAG: TlyA family RNA methyltransferase [Spirochaetes bacterium]|nr:TlyA family RNA methyltransferase [Spirochaetota bacterium]